MVTLIIGKNSNLSNALYSKVKNCFLISSRELLENIDILSRFKDRRVNIIFNNFQQAIQLNNLENASSYITNSILITAKVLDYFKTVDINKIIYTSSSSVYGNNILCNEKDELKPMNLHASLKVANEKLIEKYCNDAGIDYTLARIFNMYGGDDNFSIVSKIINAYKTDQELTIVNNGNAIRDFIHIDDVVEIYVRLLGITGRNIINIGTGNGSSIKNILDFLANNKITVRTKNIFRDELKTSTADIRLLDNVLHKDNFIKVEDYLRQELNI
ncbi:SDR family oxidoreductase [Sulfurimonas sp. HSL3-2]|uniref:NAD-dependent epimerase/dehydratase family protein n=1 Tax=Hydrocurvibacter mobilis TaxID=3131936 RepID=UPI0031F7337F